MVDNTGGSDHPPLDPGTAEKLLERLSTDDAFRERFSADPIAALAEVGYQVPEGLVPSCMSTAQMASKEEIAEAQRQIKAFLTSAAVYSNPHCFEAGKIDSSLRRK